MRNRFVLPLALALSLPSAIGAASAQPARSQDAAIRQRMGISTYSLQSISMTPSDPARAADRSSFTLKLGAALCTADLTLDPVDTADCLMLVDDGTGPMKELRPPAPTTYRGQIREVPDSVVSGSIIDGQFTGIAILPDGAWNILPLTQVDPAAPHELHIVSRFEDSLPGDWTCGVESTLSPTSRHNHPAGGDGGPLFCELAIEADYPYFQAVGGTASTVAQDIATVIANVSSYTMLSGCNLRFRIVRYVIRATPQSNPGLYNVSDPNTLLANFRTVWNNLGGTIPRDTAHMFTGRDLTGTTVGIAYLTCVCSSTFAYGLSQSRFTLQPGRRAALTAHELGHNFSANHCDIAPNTCTPCWIMLASQGSTSNQLTRYGCSASIILSYAAGRPCLSDLDSGPHCEADLDADGALTPLDLIAFQNAFATNSPDADADHNGHLNVLDFVEFLNLYSAGCP